MHTSNRHKGDVDRCKEGEGKWAQEIVLDVDMEGKERRKIKEGVVDPSSRH